MALAGHSSPDVAMRYQHAARSRLAELAAKMPTIGAPAPEDPEAPEDEA
jgi:hypothetical protein